jgi:flagellar hook-length control protein FliK
VSLAGAAAPGGATTPAPVAAPAAATAFAVAADGPAADSAEAGAQRGDPAIITRTAESRSPTVKAPSRSDGNATTLSDAAASWAATPTSGAIAAASAAVSDDSKAPNNGSPLSAGFAGISPSDPSAGGDAAAAALSPAEAAAVANQAIAAAAGGASVAGIAVAVARAASGAAAIARATTGLAVGGGVDRPALSSADDSAPTASFAAASAAQLTVNSDTATSPSPAVKVTVGGDATEFGQGLANHVSSMLDSNLTSAKLQVNPAELGPIEVRIAVQGDHASVWLMSHSAVTRDALESSSTKLREMLGAQGFAQVNVDVSQRSFQERPDPSQPYVNNGAARAATADAGSASISSATRISTGALDAYA